MSVYFAVGLRRLEDDTIGLFGRSMLRIKDDVDESFFTGWRSDLSINVASPKGPILTKSHSDEVFLVLPVFYDMNGFDRERVMVPDNQFVKCWKYQHRIGDEDHICDVVVVMARYGDVFCIAERDGYLFHIIHEGGIKIIKANNMNNLDPVAKVYRELCGYSLSRFLRRDNFNNRHWREVFPRIVG